MRERDDMTFPFEEYQRRIEELRQRMAKRLMDVAIITDPENLMYLTDYQTTGYSFFQALVVPIDDEPFMITRMMEESNVHARTWVEKTRPYSDTGDAIQMLIESLREFGLSDKVLGYERNSYFFPAYHQDYLKTAFKGSRLMDCFGIVEEGRKCKSSYELDAMRKSADAARAGLFAGVEACQAGVTENEIGGAISQAMFAAGGDFPAVMPYVTSGPRSMIGHATWEGRKVQPGEHVFIEIGGCYRRYHTALMRTVICGELSDSMYRAQETMKLALRQIREEMRPGLTVSDADHIVRSIITENDVGARLITRSGYSIGIAFPPSWDEGYIMSLKGGDSSVLEPGMTFHVIPWMWGVDGDKTCGISDTFYVTETGCGSFFRDVPQDFFIRPGNASGSKTDNTSDSASGNPVTPLAAKVPKEEKARKKDKHATEHTLKAASKS